MAPTTGSDAGMLTHLPWALATRAQLSRGSTVGVTELWDRWAGADASWDDGPAGAVEATGG